MRRFLPDERQAFCGLLALSTLIAAAAAAERNLLLDVVINSRPIGRVIEFLERDGALLAAPQDLRSLGLVLPERVRLGEAADAQPLLPLAEIPGLRSELDERGQRLLITAPEAALEPTLLGPQREAEAGAPLRSDLGAVLNYDLLATGGSGASSLGGLLEARIFSPWGVLASSFLADTSGPFGTGGPRLLRLETSLVHDDPETMRRYQLGDLVSGGLAWSRPVRLGGFQLARNFAMRPDLVTFPLPSFGGTAAVPSTVDVLVNGVRQLSSPVEPGPFAIRQLPVVAGNGEVTLVVRDALGREVTRSLPFYAASSLLAPGLTGYSLEGGWVRRHFGLVGEDYGEAAASATLRHGLTDWLTAEAHGEAMAGLAMAGGGAAMTVPGVGLVTLAAAASRGAPAGPTETAAPASAPPLQPGGGRQGWLASAGVERAAWPLNLAASLTLAGEGFRDIAGQAGDPVPRQVARASAGLSLEGLGTFGLAYIGIDRLPGGPLPQGERRRVSRSSLLSGSWSRSLGGRATLYATAYQDLRRGQDFGVMFGLSLALGQRHTAGAAAGQDLGQAYASLQASRTALEPGDYGWRLAARQGSPSQAMAEADYRAGWARMTAGVDRLQERSYGRLGLQGAIATLGRGLHLSEPIRDSFAIVQTGQPGITVLQENRPVGRTGPDGQLLVPALRAYERNRLAVDPTDLPPDAVLEQEEQQVRPAAWGGVTVAFPVRRQSSARLRLVDAAGRPLPLGSTLQRLTGEAEAGPPLPVGYDGEAFVTGLATENRILLRLPDGSTCRAEFRFQPEEGGMPLIDPVPCR